MNYLLRCVLSLIIYYIQDAYLSPTKRQMWLPFTEKETYQCYLIIGPYPYSTPKIKYLNVLCSNTYIIIFTVITWFLHSNLAVQGDSTIKQLAYLYNTFCQSLDAGREVRVVLGDISKAFDRIWHSGLLLKPQAAGVTGEVLAWFKSYLSNRRDLFFQAQYLIGFLFKLGFPRDQF